MDAVSLWPVVGLPAVRSVAGWLENSLEDGAISKFEWQQCGATILRVGIVGLATFFGLNELGVDVSALGAGASAVVMDFFLSKFKK